MQKWSFACKPTLNNLLCFLITVNPLFKEIVKNSLNQESYQTGEIVSFRQNLSNLNPFKIEDHPKIHFLFQCNRLHQNLKRIVFELMDKINQNFILMDLNERSGRFYY